MRHFIFPLLLWAAVLGCQKDTPDTLEPLDCQVKNPLVDLPWLKAIAGDEKISYLQIELGVYHKQTVYVVSTCIQCFAGGIATIYRCDGTEICHVGTYVLEPNPPCKKIIDEEITDKTLLLSR